MTVSFFKAETSTESTQEFFKSSRLFLYYGLTLKDLTNFLNSWNYFITSFGTKRAEKLLLTWKKFSGMPVSDFFFWSDFYIFSIQQNAKSRWRCGSFWMSLFFFCEFKNELCEDIRISGKWHITMLFFKELWSAENSAIFSFKS